MQTVSDIFSIFPMVFYYRRGYAVKSIKSFLLQIFMMAFLFPAMILSLTQLDWREDTVVAAFSPQKSSCLIKVLLGDDPVEMELEEYVLQVVLGEIPAEFHQEAPGNCRPHLRLESPHRRWKARERSHLDRFSLLPGLCVRGGIPGKVRN